MAYKTIMVDLPNLSVNELVEVRKRCSALLAMKGYKGADDRPSPDDDWLLLGLIEDLKARGLGATIPPYPVIKKMQIFPSFTKKSIMIRAFLEESIPDLTKMEKRALGIVVARSLAHHIMDWAELSLSTVMRFINKVPVALDEAYPGYLQSGAIRFIIKSHRENMR